jgi:hypothetical protein
MRKMWVYIVEPKSIAISSINIDALRPQVRLCLLNLVHQLGVRVGCVTEGEHSPAEAEEKPGAERDEEPEGELECMD